VTLRYGETNRVTVTYPDEEDAVRPEFDEYLRPGRSADSGAAAGPVTQAVRLFGAVHTDAFTAPSAAS
jgi:hypothetical protein